MGRPAAGTTPDAVTSGATGSVGLELDPLPVISGAQWRRAVRARLSRAAAMLRANWPRVLLGLVVGLGVSLLLAFLTPDQQVGPVRGGLAWFALTAIVTGLTTRLAMVGPRTFWQDVQGFPRRIVGMVRADGRAAGVHILLGFAAGTLITWLLGPALAGLLGVGLFVSLGTVLRAFIVGGAMVAWRWLVSRVAPRNPVGNPLDATAVGFLGASAAMALALAVPSTSVRLAIGLVAVVAALVLRGREAPSGPLTVVLAATIAAIGGALVIDATGGFELTDMVWLLVAGFGLGVVVTASKRSLSPVIGALGSGSTALTGAALGVVAGLPVLGLSPAPSWTARPSPSRSRSPLALCSWSRPSPPCWAALSVAGPGRSRAARHPRQDSRHSALRP